MGFELYRIFIKMLTWHWTNCVFFYEANLIAIFSHVIVYESTWTRWMSIVISLRFFNIFPLLPPAPVHASRLPPTLSDSFDKRHRCGGQWPLCHIPILCQPLGAQHHNLVTGGSKHLIHTSEIVTENGHWTQHWQRVSCWPAWLALFVVSLILLKIVMTVLHRLKDYERQTGGVWPS